MLRNKCLFNFKISRILCAGCLSLPECVTPIKLLLYQCNKGSVGEGMCLLLLLNNIHLPLLVSGVDCLGAIYLCKLCPQGNMCHQVCFCLLCSDFVSAGKRPRCAFFLLWEGNPRVTLIGGWGAHFCLASLTEVHVTTAVPKHSKS